MNNVVINSASDASSVNDIVETTIVLFMTVVVPMWLVLRRPGKSAAIAPDQHFASTELWDRARKMETRIEYLERVMDAELPGWRTRV